MRHRWPARGRLGLVHRGPAGGPCGLRATLAVALATLTLLAALGLPQGAAAAGSPQPGWTIVSQASPTNFELGEEIGGKQVPDTYMLIATNVGAAPSSGTVDVTDELPPGVTATRIQGLNDFGATHNTPLSCSLPTLTCSTNEPVAPFDILTVLVEVAPTSGAPARVTNAGTITEGGAPAQATVTSSPNTLNMAAPERLAVEDFAFGAFTPSGAPATSAGDHPFALTTDLALPSVAIEEKNSGVAENGGPLPVPVEEEKDVVVELPLGFLGNPSATPQCTLANAVSGKPTCPASAEVGYLVYDRASHASGASVSGNLNGVSPIYNVTPEGGYPAEFATEILSIGVTLHAAVVREGGQYRLRVLVPGLFRYDIDFEQVVFYGDPAAGNDGGEPTGEPFLTDPEDCEASAPTATVHIDSWQNPAAVPLNNDGSPDLDAIDFSEPQWSTAEASLPEPTGCGLLAPLFAPALSMAPSSAGEEGDAQADSPSAYTTELKVPQSNDPTVATPVFDASFDETPGTPPVKDVAVSLPAGVSVSPSAATGLQACSPEEEQLEANVPAECPEASKIGSVQVETPLLARRDLEEGSEYGQVLGAEPIDGSVYLVAPQGEDLKLDGAGAGTFRLLIELRSQRYGIDIKIPGAVTANEATGQLTAAFQENPQLPFSDLKLHFHGGPRAPLANPQECGDYTNSATISSWAEPEGGVPSSNSFEVGGCGASLLFAPTFDAGTATAAAGAYSPFALSFARSDGEQSLGGIAVKMPDGLLGKIAGVAKCSEAEVQAIERTGTGSCAPGSEIGSAAVTAGPGADPFSITDGKAFLTGPYGGGPFGLAIVVPAVAGPFDLGEVVVRASIQVDPRTAALTVVSSQLPQIRDGVPFRLRSANVQIDRPDFMRNATSCAQQSIAATIAGEHPLGSSEAVKSAAVSSPYAANGCASLAFQPTLTASTNGRTSRKEGATLTVKLSFAQEGQANVRRVHVQVPKRLPARQSTLKNACPEATFATNPAACPTLSVIGSATAVTPLLNVPLEGPAYYVSHGGAAFPEIVAVLQGEGVTIDLHGETFISNKGIITSTFASVPDAPVSSFELSLPQGSDSVLAAPNGKLCEGALEMPTTIDGQNGARVEQHTRIAVSGCKARTKPKVTIVKVRRAGKRLLVTVKTNARGRLRLSGAGIRPMTKNGLAAGRHRLALRLKAKHPKKSKLRATLTVGKQSAKKTKTAKL